MAHLYLEAARPLLCELRGEQSQDCALFPPCPVTTTQTLQNAFGAHLCALNSLLSQREKGMLWQAQLAGQRRAELGEGAPSWPEGSGTWKSQVVRAEAQQKGLAGKPGRERQPREL